VRTWKYNFRLGASGAISRRLYEQVAARRREASTVAHEAVAARKARVVADAPLPTKADALAIVERDQVEVDQVWEGRSKSFGTASSIGHTTNRGGYNAGQDAGRSVHLGGGRAGLGAGQGRLK
jgi:hypothetical protein